MRFSFDADLGEQLVSQLLSRESQNTGRDTEATHHESLPIVHLSDLIVSLPQAWYKRRGYLQEFDSSSRHNMAIGVVGQEALRSITGMHLEVPVGRYVYGPDGGEPIAWLVGHIDGVTYGADPTVWEVKVTRASARRQDTSEHYFDQMGGYADMLGVTRGRLVLIHRLEQQHIFRVGEVEWDKQELAEWRTELDNRVWTLLNSPEPPWGQEYAWAAEYNPLPIPRPIKGYWTGFFGRPL